MKKYTNASIKTALFHAYALYGREKYGKKRETEPSRRMGLLAGYKAAWKLFEHYLALDTPASAVELDAAIERLRSSANLRGDIKQGFLEAFDEAIEGFYRLSREDAGVHLIIQ